MPPIGIFSKNLGDTIMTLLKKAYLNRQDAKIAKETKEYIRNFDQFVHFYKFYSFVHKKSWRSWRLGGFFQGVNNDSTFVENLGVLGDLAVLSENSRIRFIRSIR
jgi:hypothetical protein